MVNFKDETDLVLVETFFTGSGLSVPFQRHSFLVGWTVRRRRPYESGVGVFQQVVRSEGPWKGNGNLTTNTESTYHI